MYSLVGLTSKRRSTASETLLSLLLAAAARQGYNQFKYLVHATLTSFLIVQVYPLELGDKFRLVLATTLSEDGTPGDVDYNPLWENTPSRADQFEYVMYGKVCVSWTVASTLVGRFILLYTNCCSCRFTV